MTSRNSSGPDGASLAIRQEFLSVSPSARSVLIDIESLQLPTSHAPKKERRRLTPSSRTRLLSVISLCVVLPLEFSAVFVSSLNVITIVFGAFVASIAVGLLSAYMMRELHVERELDFVLLLVAASVIAASTAAFVGYDLNQWELFGRPSTVKVTNIRRPMYNISTDENLHSFDLSGLHVAISNRHIGQYLHDDRIFCAAPLYVKGSLARKIESSDDIPLNWGVCYSKPLSEESDFSCEAFWRDSVLDHSDPQHNTYESSLAFEDQTLLECLRGWAMYDRGFDLGQVSKEMTKNSLQAVKVALESWTPLEKEIDNPLVLFDDDEDLRDLTLVRLVDECCTLSASRYAWKTLRDFIIGNALWVFYCLSLAGRLRRQRKERDILGVFVCYLLTVVLLLFVF